MDRIFEKNSIEQICEDIKKIIKDSKEYMEDMLSIANKADDALSQVPSYAKEYKVSQAAGSLRSHIRGMNLDTVISRLDSCKTRATDLIPMADSQFAKETDALKDTIAQIKSALNQIRDFLVDTPLTVDYNSFLINLEVARANCQKILDEAGQTLDTLLCNVKGAEEISQVFSKDPVNLCTGNFIYDRTDLEISGTEPFIFRRFYNAINNRKGSLGFDWNHNFEVLLECDGEERVLVLEDGKEERFLKTSTGLYVSVYHSNGVLKKTDDGYVYLTREQKKYYFDDQGYCICQKPLNGAVTRLIYEQTETSRRLVEVKRETGEWFQFRYDERGMLRHVADHTGRIVTYELIDDKLAGVCTPNGYWFRYHYKPEGKLESVENPRGIITVENMYDGQMRTVSQRFPDGGTMSYVYDDEKRAVELTERNGSKVIYLHDERFRDIRHIYRDGEERFEYNKNNQKTLAVDKLGNKTQFAYDTKGNLSRIINALGVQVDLRYEEHNKPVSIAVNGKEKLHSRYDQNGNLIETKDALGNVYRISYKSQGLPSEIVQPDGSRITISYDSRGNITSLTDASGSFSQYFYDDLNRVIKSVDGNGNATFYEYDAEDNITKVINANGDCRCYQYNESGKVVEIKDFNGSSVKREYNVLNKPSKIINQMGKETLLTYDSMWNLARITEPNGAKTTFIYNEDNRLGRIRKPNGAIIRYTYDANGNRTSITDEENAKTSFVYDAVGRLCEVTGADGSKMIYGYDEEGNLIQATDALENTVNLTYDDMGNLIRETNPVGECRSYTYTPLGQIESVTDETGLVTTYRYGAGGNLIEITHPDKTVERYTYDRNGNIKTYTDQRGYTLAYLYDCLDRMISIEGSGGERKSYVYDAVGNVVSMTDSNGNITRYEYSLTGKLTKVIDPLGNTCEYGYDACDRLIEIRQYGEFAETADQMDGLNGKLAEFHKEGWIERQCQRTCYERDLSGNIIKITDALGQTESYSYDLKGQLLSKLDKEGYLTRYGYTPAGDVAQIQYEDGRAVKFGYNPLRQLIQIEDWLGITKIKNDALGRVENVIFPDGKNVSYTYGKTGERTSITYPDGRTVYYGYDKNKRLAELKTGDAVITYGYDEAGFLSEKNFPNGIKSSYTYDWKGQILELTHQDKEGVLDQYRYEYDLMGNKIGIQKRRRGLETESGDYSYGYDALGRLESVTKDGVLQRSYVYDAFSNRIRQNEKGNETAYTYNGINQLIQQIDTEGEKKFLYDKRGNLVQILKNGEIKNQYIYGVLNRMELAVNNEGKTARYIYNGLGHRVGQEIGAGRSLNNEEILNPLYKLNLQELNPEKCIQYTIDLTRDYNNLLQIRSENKEQIYFWDGFIAGYAEGNSQEIIDFYLLDELSSPLRLTDYEGNVKDYYGYNEFGMPLYSKNLDLQPFGYIGYQRDSVAQTYYAQAREYYPESGRFGGRDLVKGTTVYPVTLNEYIYCANNPIFYVDVNGLFWHIICGAVVGAVANTAISIGTNIISGQVPDWNSVAAAAAGGAVTGAVTAATGNTTLGMMAGGAVERTVDGALHGKNVGEIVQDVAIGAATDLAFSKVTKAIGNTTQAKQITKQFKSTKVGQRVFKGKINYDRQISRARTLWDGGKGKAIMMRSKTYLNGFWGVTGTKALSKATYELRDVYFPGMDIKAEMKNMLETLYDSGEEWITEKRKIQEYMNKEFDKLLKDIDNKELSDVFCLD